VITAADMLREAAKVNELKNDEYGRGYERHGQVMEGLFPDGVTLMSETDFARFALFDLLVVKLVRYAANFSNGHDDSLLDISVYASLLREMDNEHTDNRGGAGAGPNDSGTLVPKGGLRGEHSGQGGGRG